MAIFLEHMANSLYIEFALRRITLRKKFFILLFLLVLASGIILSVASYIYTDKVIDNLRDNSQEELDSYVNDKIYDYDAFFTAIRDDVTSVTSKALLNIYSQIGDKTKRQKFSPQELKTIATANNVDQIYFIDFNGIVTNSSFTPDINHDLFTHSKALRDQLKSMFGNCNYSLSQAVLSSKNGRPYMYAYYSPKGSDYCLEVSIDIVDFIKQKYSSTLATFLLHSFNKEKDIKFPYVSKFDIYDLNNISGWSLVNIGEKCNISSDIMQKALTKQGYIYKNKGHIRVLKRITLPSRRAATNGTTTIYDATYDFSVIYNLGQRIIAYTIAFCIIILSLSFLSIRLFFRKYVFIRIKKINDSIIDFQNTHNPTNITVQGRDELNSIANNINLMSKEIAKYHDELRHMTSNLSLIEERQRREIATNLHDHTSQALAVAILNVKELQNLYKDTEETSSLLANIGDSLEKVLTEVRECTFELSCATLYRFGLRAAIEELLENRCGKNTDYTCKLVCDDNKCEISEDIKVILFQAVKELLINIEKHAKATSVEVSIKIENGNIIITIKDDGVGFDINTVARTTAKGEHFGLFNIKERLRYIDGNFEIFSEIDKGSKFVLTAPLEINST